MPHAARVEQVLDEVRRTTWSAVATMRINQLASCVYHVLSQKRIVFDHEPISLRVAQRVRSTSRVLSMRTVPVGNCLELALTFAACLEAAHREPLIFQFVHRDGCTGHALVGFWLSPPCPFSREVVYRDSRLFVVKRPRNITVLDVTGVSVNQPKTCFRACRAANALFFDPMWNFRFALDVVEARRRGILPWGYPE
jgi:hypothetical protein